MTHSDPLAADIEALVERSGEVLRDLRGARLFATGGTGFVGRWLLRSLAWANRTLALDASAVVLSRDPDTFRAAEPVIGDDPAFEWVTGDVRSFEAPAGPFTHVLHAATETRTAVNDADPDEALDVAIAGTRRVLACAEDCGVQRVLFTSSGAVYGTQPPGTALLAEEHADAPDAAEPAGAYAQGKRAAEALCVEAAQRGLPVTIARLFAFVGPHLPLAEHYAIGNFIADGLAGREILVAGDGSPVRSYLYAADMAEWLWTILVRGRPGRAYNVGSERALSVAEVASAVAATFDPPPAVRIAGGPAGSGSGGRYVPSTRRAREELGLRETVALDEAIRRTVDWHEALRRPA